MFLKGVDLVGWRGCARQKEWGQKRFVATLKKIGRQAADFASTPAPTGVAQTPDQRKRLQQYEELKQGAAIFRQGTPECAECPLSAGKPYGCYVGLEYPIDSTAERSLFEFFAGTVTQEGSASEGIYRDVVSKTPSSGTPWHTDRGPIGTLAEIDQPLVKEWGFLMWKKRADSAQLLGSMFFTQTRDAIIAVFAKFWEDFIEHARSNPDYASSKTLEQLTAISEFYDRVSTTSSTQDGVAILVDNDVPSEHKH
jgi:hypothetical protein